MSRLDAWGDGVTLQIAVDIVGQPATLYTDLTSLPRWVVKPLESFDLSLLQALRDHDHRIRNAFQLREAAQLAEAKLHMSYIAGWHYDAVTVQTEPATDDRALPETVPAPLVTRTLAPGQDAAAAADHASTAPVGAPLAATIEAKATSPAAGADLPRDASIASGPPPALAEIEYWSTVCSEGMPAPPEMQDCANPECGAPDSVTRLPVHPRDAPADIVHADEPQVFDAGAERIHFGDYKYRCTVCQEPVLGLRGMLDCVNAAYRAPDALKSLGKLRPGPVSPWYIRRVAFARAQRLG